MLSALKVGLLAALRVPLWVRGRRVERLIDRTSGGAQGGTSTAGALPARVGFSLRVARGLLRRLAWLPLSPWRNTCLYRSIAECLVLRQFGVPAAIRLGVRNESPPHGPIVAHAWVVYPGSGGSPAHVELVAAAEGR